MAGRGPAPRDNKDATILKHDGERYGPPLPDASLALGPGEDWHPMTQRWWDGLRQHPLMSRDPQFGWDYLVDTALSHHKMWSYGRTDLAAEIRIRLANYAITPADRQRMQIAVVTPSESTDDAPAGDDATVVRMDDQRKRLSRKRLSS